MYASDQHPATNKQVSAARAISDPAVVLNMLQDPEVRLGMSYLFVDHDLHVRRPLRSQVIALKGGRAFEVAAVEQVLEVPRAAYTQALLALIPQPPV